MVGIPITSSLICNIVPSSVLRKTAAPFTSRPFMSTARRIVFKTVQQTVVLVIFSQCSENDGGFGAQGGSALDIDRLRYAKFRIGTVQRVRQLAKARKGNRNDTLKSGYFNYV
jgi:hypothetical protein